LNKKIKQFLILFLIIFAFVIARYYGLQDLLNFEYLKSQKDTFIKTYNENEVLFIIIYFVVYVVSVAISFPGATIFTLAAGAIFGVVTGTILVSFASTLGATLSFLFSRYLFRDIVQSKFGSSLDSINKGLEEDGKFYLLSLRLIPAFPFFLINLLMGLSKISVLQFFLVSQIGMLPGTIVYVNAGTQLASLSNPKDIVSFPLLLSFLALGLLPLFAKFIVSKIKLNKIYKNYKKPSHFDYNIIAIGGGAAGLVTSYIASTVKAKVALIEKHKMGGDCLNYGCVPSKAIISSAKKVHLSKKGKDFGLKKVEIEFDFLDIMNRVSNIIKTIEPNDSIERYSKLGVDCITGRAKILSPYEIEVNGKILTTKNIVIATGASPLIPNIPGINQVPYLTSETLWKLQNLPKNFLIIGAGAIGCEMAQAFSRLGSKVTLVEFSDKILPRDDNDVSNFMNKILTEEGINILTSHKLIEFIKNNNTFIAKIESNAAIKEIEFDNVLLSLGRKPRIEGFGLEELGVKISNRKSIEVNEFMETNYPNIFACGDVAGPFQLTHTASHEAWYASVNALFGIFKKFKTDYSVVPYTTFTDPEVSHVGLSEEQATQKNIPVEITKYDLNDLDRAITESENKGFIKVLTEPGKDRILGATIVGYNAGELLSEFVLAMKYKIGLNKILGTIHAYPTMGEGNKYVAGNWKKARKPEKLLKIVEEFHRWRRK
jgi:dihydrolipoamide dehydrogenase